VEDGGKLGSYLFSTTLNLARTRHRQEEALLILPGDIPPWMSLPPKSPDRIAMDREAGREVHEAVSHLPPKAHEVVTLRYLEGYTREEIAVMLECPLGTVDARLSRAKERLRSAPPLLRKAA
jgi:RNA polymerase sigma factor (sigma-70 family)